MFGKSLKCERCLGCLGCQANPDLSLKGCVAKHKICQSGKLEISHKIVYLYKKSVTNLYKQSQSGIQIYDLSVWDGYVVNTNTNKDDTPIKGDILSLDRRKGI